MFNEIYKNDLNNILSFDLPWKNFNNKKVLITGANGLIGSCLTDLFLLLRTDKKINVEINILVRNKEKAQKRFNNYLKTDLNIIEQDIRLEIPSNLKFDYIINAASNAHPIAYSLHPIETLLTNVLGTKNLLDCAVKSKSQKVIEISSSEVYGERGNSNYIFQEDEYGVVNCNKVRASYPEGKRAAEALCQGYIEEYNLDISILRPGRIYGPTMSAEDTKATAQFINKAVKNENIVLKSTGEQIFSFAYVVDVISAIIYLVFYGENGAAYNVADKKSTIKLKELAEIAAKAGDSKVIYDLPNEIEAKGFSNSPGMVLDCTKLEKIGWQALTHIEEGINKTVNILKQNEK